MPLEINITQLPADLTSAYILSFLVNHDWDDIAPVLSEKDKKALALDQDGVINLDAKAKKFTIQLPTINNRSKWIYERPDTIIVDLDNAPGTLYTAKDAPLPDGANKFWIQQYTKDPRTPGAIGRTVIEFYTNDVITAVFKTKVDNYGGAGAGVWSRNST